MTDWCNTTVYPFSWPLIGQELEQLENSPPLANICFCKIAVCCIFPLFYYYYYLNFKKLNRIKDLTQIKKIEIIHPNYAFFKIMQMPLFVKFFAFYCVLPFVVFQAGIQQWQAPVSSLLGDTFKYLPFNLIFNAILEWLYLINFQPEVPNRGILLYAWNYKCPHAFKKGAAKL